MATFHLVYQLARRYAVISVNENLSPAFLRVIREAGCYDRMTSMRSIEKPFTMPMGEFYMPEELEEEFVRIGRRQVEKEKAQLIVIACTVIALFLNPGAKERLIKELGVIVADVQEIAVKTAEMLVNLGLSHSKLEYPQLEN